MKSYHLSPSHKLVNNEASLLVVDRVLNKDAFISGQRQEVLVFLTVTNSYAVAFLRVPRQNHRKFSGLERKRPRPDTKSSQAVGLKQGAGRRMESKQQCREG